MCEFRDISLKHRHRVHSYHINFRDTQLQGVLVELIKLHDIIKTLLIRAGHLIIEWVH